MRGSSRKYSGIIPEPFRGFQQFMRNHAGMSHTFLECHCGEFRGYFRNIVGNFLECAPELPKSSHNGAIFVIVGKWVVFRGDSRSIWRTIAGGFWYGHLDGAKMAPLWIDCGNSGAHCGEFRGQIPGVSPEFPTMLPFQESTSHSGVIQDQLLEAPEWFQHGSVMSSEWFRDYIVGKWG